MAGNANPQMEHGEIFTGAYRKARQLNRKYPVTKKHIPEGHKYHINGEEKVFKRKTLESIKEFSKSFMDNEFRSKAFNHVQYMELTDYLFSAFAAKAQEKAEISEGAYAKFNASLRGIFEKEVVPFDVLMLGREKFKDYVPFGALDSLYRSEGWKFADFAAALWEFADGFRHGYSGRLRSDKAHLGNLERRSQPEHAFFHAIYFTTGICREIGQHYKELQEAKEKTFIL